MFEVFYWRKGKLRKRTNLNEQDAISLIVKVIADEKAIIGRIREQDNIGREYELRYDSVYKQFYLIRINRGRG